MYIYFFTLSFASEEKLSNQNYLFENEKRMITEEMRGTRELRFDSPPLMFHWH